jgi:hypothetical protein
MLCNPRYGRLGMFAVPFFWLFEALGPVIEVVGFTSLLVSAALGILDVHVFWLFLGLAILHGMVLSQVAAGVEAMLLQRYPSSSDRLVLFAASFVEFLGFHQLVTVERFLATFQTGARRRQWGVMTRSGIPSEPSPQSQVAASDRR